MSMKGLKIFSIVAVLFAVVACGQVDASHQHIWDNDTCVECGASLFVTYAWRIKSFNGNAVDADLYIKFDNGGTFLMMQRSGSMGYTEYRGTYTMDKENSILSGEYSDGESWVCDYNFSFNESHELVLESITETPEVSVYEASEMPNMTEQTRCGGGVELKRPL